MTWNKIWQITNITNKLTSNLEKEQVFAAKNRHSIMSMQKSRRKSITLEYCSHPCAECCKELMMFGSEHNTNNLITSHSGTIRNLHPANNFPHSQRLFSFFHLDYPGVGCELLLERRTYLLYWCAFALGLLLTKWLKFCMLWVKVKHWKHLT